MKAPRETERGDAPGPGSDAPQASPHLSAESEQAVVEAVCGPAPWGTAVVDARRETVLRVNAPFARMLGQPPEALRGRPLKELFEAGSRAALAQQLRRLRAGGDHAFESMALRADGAPLSVRVDATAVQDATGRPWRWVLHVEDLTQREALAQDLARVSAEFESIRAQLGSFIDQAPDGIFVADLDGRYLEVNRAGCEILGCEPADILGKTIVDLLPP